MAQELYLNVDKTSGFTAEAGAAIPAYSLVYVTGAGTNQGLKVAVTTAQTDRPVGWTMYTAAAGENVTVYTRGIFQVRLVAAAANTAIEGVLSPGAGGTVDSAATTVGDYIVGRAMNVAAPTEMVAFIFAPAIDEVA